MHDLDKIELTRMLIHLMEERLNDNEEQATGAPRKLFRALGRSRLIPLPSGALPGLENGQETNVACPLPPDESGEVATCNVTVRRTGEDFQVSPSDLPERFEPLAIVIGRFPTWDSFERAVWGKTALASPTDAGERLAADEVSAHELAAADDSATPVSFESGDVQCHYHGDGFLDVAMTRDPECSETLIAVAEANYFQEGKPVHQLRLLEFGRGKSRASAQMRALSPEQIQIIVRPFQTKDLGLFSPGKTSALLAEMDFASMALESTDDGDNAKCFVFRPTLDHQKRMIEHQDACWCIRFAEKEKEVNDDV